jgi:hypothetical protein
MSVFGVRADIVIRGRHAKLCYNLKRAGRVVWFAPFDAKACEALAARSGLLPFLEGGPPRLNP